MSLLARGSSFHFALSLQNEPGVLYEGEITIEQAPLFVVNPVAIEPGASSRVLGREGHCNQL